MRVIFMGTPDFAVGTLEEIIKAGHEVALVVSQPDKAVGRSKALRYTPVKACALEHGIEVYQPQKVRDSECIERLRTYHPDIIIVEAFGQIIPRAILDMPRYGCVNVHASLLPKYRGAAPIQWVVIDGEKESGVTTMMMDVEMDTGDMLEKTVVKLNPDETGGSLFDRLSLLGGSLILSTLGKLEKGEIIPQPQDHEKATYVKKISKSMGDIDWTMDAVSIERLVRGLNPWPSAFTRWNGRMLKIWEAKVLPDPAVKAPCGSVISAGEEGLKIQTGNGVLCVTSLQLEGKKRMDTAAFLRGYQIDPGCIMERRE